MDGSGGLWYVQLADGDVHRVTLDQLDEGFQAGHIDSNTMVLPAGASRWEKLGQIAGIDDDVEPKVAHPDAVRGVPKPAAAVAPPSMPRPTYSARPTFAAPPRAAVVAPAPHALVLNSYRPVSVDLSELDLEAALPHRSGKRWAAALVAAAMVAGLTAVVVKQPGFARPYLSRLRNPAMTVKSVAAAALRPHLATADRPPPVTALTVAPVLTPRAEIVPVTPADPAGDDQQPRSPESRKHPGPKTKAHKGHAAQAPTHGPAVPKAGPTFTTSGNKYDPLSSSI